MSYHPQVYYDSSNYRLHSLRVHEEPVSLHAEVTDKRDPQEVWQVTAVLYRLAVFQYLVTEFTDPSSFSLPPTFTLPGTAEADASTLSVVDLSDLLAGRYAQYAAAGMGPWELSGQRLHCVDGVYYQLITRLSARSNIVWDTNAFRKVKLPRI